MLAWAQRALAEYSGLQQELSEMRDGMVGRLRIGAIPVTLPTISLLTTPFARRHQRIDIVVTSHHRSRSSAGWTSSGWMSASPTSTTSRSPGSAACRCTRSATCS